MGSNIGKRNALQTPGRLVRGLNRFDRATALKEAQESFSDTVRDLFYECEFEQTCLDQQRRLYRSGQDDAATMALRRAKLARTARFRLLNTLVNLSAVMIAAADLQDPIASDDVDTGLAEKELNIIAFMRELGAAHIRLEDGLEGPTPAMVMGELGSLIVEQDPDRSCAEQARSCVEVSSEELEGVKGLAREVLDLCDCGGGDREGEKLCLECEKRQAARMSAREE
jgi:hypothetical protein